MSNSTQTATAAAPSLTPNCPMPYMNAAIGWAGGKLWRTLNTIGIQHKTDWSYILKDDTFQGYGIYLIQVIKEIQKAAGIEEDGFAGQGFRKAVLDMYGVDLNAVLTPGPEDSVSLFQKPEHGQSLIKNLWHLNQPRDSNSLNKLIEDCNDWTNYSADSKPYPIAGDGLFCSPVAYQRVRGGDGGYNVDEQTPEYISAILSRLGDGYKIWVLDNFRDYRNYLPWKNHDVQCVHFDHNHLHIATALQVTETLSTLSQHKGSKHVFVVPWRVMAMLTYEYAPRRQGFEAPREFTRDCILGLSGPSCTYFS